MVHGNSVSKVNGKVLKGTVQGSDVTGSGFGDNPLEGGGPVISPSKILVECMSLSGAGVVMGPRRKCSG